MIKLLKKWIITEEEILNIINHYNLNKDSHLKEEEMELLKNKEKVILNVALKDKSLEEIISLLDFFNPTHESMQHYILLATSYGRKDFLEYFITNGDIDSELPYNGFIYDKIFVYMSKYGWLELMKTICSQKDISQNYQYESLKWALVKNHIEIVKFLIDDIKLNILDHTGRSFLNWAVKSGNEDILEYMFEKIPVIHEIEITHILRNALTSDNPKMIEIVSSKGCFIDKLTWHDLIYKIKEVKVPALKKAVELGLLPDKDTKTIFNESISFQNLELATFIADDVLKFEYILIETEKEFVFYFKKENFIHSQSFNGSVDVFLKKIINPELKSKILIEREKEAS